jgi:hypothetical protein
MVNQEPNQETLFLVGSWLRPEDFGFGHPLVQISFHILRQIFRELLSHPAQNSMSGLA